MKLRSSSVKASTNATRMPSILPSSFHRRRATKQLLMKSYKHWKRTSQIAFSGTWSRTSRQSITARGCARRHCSTSPNQCAKGHQTQLACSLWFKILAISCRSWARRWWARAYCFSLCSCVVFRYASTTRKKKPSKKTKKRRNKSIGQKNIRCEFRGKLMLSVSITNTIRL